MEGAFRLGVVAAETSGDKLGSGVVRALRSRYPKLTIRGIGGPELASEGLESLCDIHDLSVMGLEDIVRKLPRALLLRRRLFQDFIKDPPDVFLGIDSPDFNLTLESWLRAAGIPVAHLVSPTVWAWRGYRVRKIRRAVDRMLVLFPFEEAFYRERGVPATFVGHPAADEVADLNLAKARRCLAVPPGKRVVSILPGSRVSEIKHLAPVFTQTINKLALTDPDLEFLLPFANAKVRETFFEAVGENATLPQVRFLDGQARTALAASDAALLASGTAALEAALVGCPMVVAYRVSAVSFWFARMLATTRYVSMPNHLMPTPLVPEFLQDQADQSNLSGAIARLLTAPGHRNEMLQGLSGIRDTLQRDANHNIARLLGELAFE